MLRVLVLLVWGAVSELLVLLVWVWCVLIAGIAFWCFAVGLLVFRLGCCNVLRLRVGSG